MKRILRAKAPLSHLWLGALAPLSHLTTGIDSRGERDWKRAHVMLYVTLLRGISFDVGVFRRRRRSTHHTYDVFHECTSIYRTTGTVPVTTGARDTRTLNCTRGYQETCTVDFAWIFCRAALLLGLNPSELCTSCCQLLPLYWHELVVLVRGCTET